MKIPFLDLKAQYTQIEHEVLPALREVCDDCQFVLGPKVAKFEKEFAAFCGAKQCVAVNSGTSALHLALRCLGVGRGDEVIVPAMTFVATAWAVSYTGATPAFADIKAAQRTLDPASVEAAITPRTKAILPVHLYGMPADMDAINAVAARHGLAVVEDAAQAHGARYCGKPVGTFGKACCFSFYPGKNLGAYGEGGAVVTDDDAFAEYCRCLRDHGQRRRYHHETVAYNYRMEGFQGAVLSIKLPRLAAWNRGRRRNADLYRRLLKDVPNLTVPAEADGFESVYHLFVIEVDNRDEVARKLHEAGVQTGLHYPVCVHRQEAYADLHLGAGSFPISERLANRCLSLPMYAELTEEQIKEVSETLIGVVAG